MIHRQQLQFPPSFERCAYLGIFHDSRTFCKSKKTAWAKYRTRARQSTGSDAPPISRNSTSHISGCMPPLHPLIQHLPYLKTAPPISRNSTSHILKCMTPPPPLQRLPYLKTAPPISRNLGNQKSGMTLEKIKESKFYFLPD